MTLRSLYINKDRLSNDNRHMLCYVMLCYVVMLCYILLCCVILCCVVLCCVVLSYVCVYVYAYFYRYVRLCYASLYLLFFPQQLPYFNLALSSFRAPGSHQLVCVAYYLVLSFFSCIRVAVCL